MKLNAAKKLAAQWIKDHYHELPGFIGAYFAGSTIQMDGEQELPPASDLDIMAVLDVEEMPEKLGKFRYQGVLLEVSYLKAGELDDLNHVLTTHYLAYNLHCQTVIMDLTGKLTAVQQQVEQHYGEPDYVNRRIQNTLAKIKGGVTGINYDLSFYDVVNACLFSAGIMTHVILIGALQNCTVRTRYTAVRKVLERYGLLAEYHELLAILGADQLSRKVLLGHLRELETAFDLAAGCKNQEFFFSSDITPDAKVISIQGSEEIIHGEYPQEAVFWMAATYARCLKILDTDAPDLFQKCLPAFNAFARDLGICDVQDLQHRAEQILNYLPKLEKTADRVYQLASAQL